MTIRYLRKAAARATSLEINIPQGICTELKLKEGTIMDVNVKNNQIIITPSQISPYQSPTIVQENK